MDKTQKDLTIKDFIEYVNTNTTEIITKSVFAPMSTNLFKKQFGVTAETALNLLDTAVTFGDGSVCGFDDNVQSTISQRTIVPGYIKVNFEYCDKVFLNSWANHMVNMAAGNEQMPFEQALIADIVKNVGQELEFAIWQGEKETTPTSNLGFFDGLIKIIKDANVTNVGAAQTTMLARVWDVYNAIPDTVLFDEVIYMSNSNFRKLVKELVDANMYHYERNIDESMDIILPGTNTHVKAVNGLSKYNSNADPDFIVALNPNHVVYGVDLENDQEKVKVWFSDDNDTLRGKISFSAGVQIALPNEVVASYAEESGSGSGNGQ